MQQIVDILAAESHSDDHSELDLNRFDSGFKCSEFDEFASLCLLRQRYVVCIASQVAHFSSTHSKQNTSAGTRVKALTARIAVAEARLGSLHIAITASKGNKTYSNNDGGANLSTVTSFGCIRACRSDDVDKVCSIYEQVRLLLSCSSHRLISMCMYLQAFADLGGRHTSVRKFVKLSVKEISFSATVTVSSDIDSTSVAAADCHKTLIGMLFGRKPPCSRVSTNGDRTNDMASTRAKCC
jgi:hypothetical protein